MIEMVIGVTRKLLPSLARVRTSKAASVQFIKENGGGLGVHLRNSANESLGRFNRTTTENEANGLSLPAIFRVPWPTSLDNP